MALLGLVPDRDTWLEGKTNIVVADPDTGEDISDFDLIEDGVLWEKKSAERIRFSDEARDAITRLYSEDEQRELIQERIEEWCRKNVVVKLAKLLNARALTPFYERARIGFIFHRPSDEEIARRSDNAIDPETEAREIQMFRAEVNYVIDHLQEVLLFDDLAEPQAVRWEQ